jgi:hypothetical protein
MVFALFHFSLAEDVVDMDNGGATYPPISL